MSRAIFVAFFTCVGLVHASREDGVVAEGDLHVSVGTRHFQVEAADEGLAAQSAQKAASASRDRAKAQLQELAAEKQRVRQVADALDERMQTEYAQMVGKEVHEASNFAESLLSATSEIELKRRVQQGADALNQQMSQMEKQSAQILQWFEEMSQLRKSRDEMWARKAEAVQEAEAAGLGKEEVQKELSAAGAQPKPETAPPGDGAAAVSNAHMEQRKEMDQIESAASDVMDSLGAFAELKEKGDESSEHAAQAKAKLEKALKFIEEHENVVD